MTVIFALLFIGSFILSIFTETIGSFTTFHATIFFGILWIGRIMIEVGNAINKSITKK